MPESYGLRVCNLITRSKFHRRSCFQQLHVHIAPQDGYFETLVMACILFVLISGKLKYLDEAARLRMRWTFRKLKNAYIYGNIVELVQCNLFEFLKGTLFQFRQLFYSRAIHIHHIQNITSLSMTNLDLGMCSKVDAFLFCLLVIILQ